MPCQTKFNFAIDSAVANRRFYAVKRSKQWEDTADFGKKRNVVFQRPLV